MFGFWIIYTPYYIKSDKRGTEIAEVQKKKIRSQNYKLIGKVPHGLINRKSQYPINLWSWRCQILKFWPHIQRPAFLHVIHNSTQARPTKKCETSGSSWNKRLIILNLHKNIFMFYTHSALLPYSTGQTSGSCGNDTKDCWLLLCDAM